MEYNKCELQEIASMKYGKMPKKDKIVDKGYPIYSGYKITGFYEEYMYDDEMIIVVARGVGGTGDVKLSPPKSYITNLSIILDTNENLVDKKYLQLLLHYMKLKYLDSGSAQSQITINDLKRLKICLPNIKHQKKISSFIKLINRKIEINQNIIANLEELSQTLFKRWFIEFEFPDENNEPYKSSGGEMVDSELGEIPKGWRVNNINDFANNNVITGKTPSTKVKENYSETGIPFLTIPDMHKDVFALNTERYISETGIEKLGKKIIAKNSLAISCIATPGLVSITSSDTLTNQQINSLTPNKNELYYLYFYLKGMRNYIRDLGSGGSATLNLNKTQFAKIKLVKPISELLLKYDKLVRSNFEIILNFQKENNYLTQLRDTLLPKLMSGEIEIPDDIEVNEDELSI